nr:hypothetical protein [Tanacetum cinerariifolium]
MAIAFTRHVIFVILIFSAVVFHKCAANVCEHCCTQCPAASQYQGKEMSFVDKSFTDEKITLGNCMPKCFWHTCWCCMKDGTGWEIHEDCNDHCK